MCRNYPYVILPDHLTGKHTRAHERTIIQHYPLLLYPASLTK
jgi:hypothetical protein